MLKTAGTLALASYDDIFKMESPPYQVGTEQIQDVSLEQLHPFENHPFQVRDDEEMQRTAESIGQYGVLVPAIARPRPDGGYELISGHRRKRASELAGKAVMPVIIRELDDDEATIIMVDSNLQREKLLPSEKAWAFRMKLEAMNHQGAVLSGFPQGTTSVAVLAEQADESKSQIFRYIRLTELVPALSDMVDAGRIALSPAVELSYLTRKEQADLVDTMERHEVTPSLSQAQRLKKRSKSGELTLALMDEILSEQKVEPVKITLTGNKLVQYFPREYTPRQMEDIIIKLLERWRENQ